MEIKELLVIEENKSLKETQSSSLSLYSSTSESDSMIMESIKKSQFNESGSIESKSRKTIHNIN